MNKRIYLLIRTTLAIALIWLSGLTPPDNASLNAAQASGWQVVSMQKDLEGSFLPMTE